MEMIHIAIMKATRIVKKSVSVHYEEVSWTANEGSGQNTPKKFLCKCIEKLRDLGNYLVFVVAVIKFLSGCG